MHIKGDPYFVKHELAIDEILEARHYIGCALQQVQEFLDGTVHPALVPWKTSIEGAKMVELNV